MDGLRKSMVAHQTYGVTWTAFAAVLAALAAAALVPEVVLEEQRLSGSIAIGQTSNRSVAAGTRCRHDKWDGYDQSDASDRDTLGRDGDAACW